MKTLLLFAILTTTAVRAEDTAALQKRVAQLEAQVAQLSKPDPAAIVQANKLAARERARIDRQTYSPEQLREIEALYQVANHNWRSPEAVESLEKLVSKFDKANRTGCAVLYLGQMSKGEKRLEYLQSAVKNFSDCYYFDGCQVGGYARLVLADTLIQLDRKPEADQLFAELRKDFPTATDHKGRLITDLIPAGH